MELQQLRYFVSVAEQGNISKAAQKLFLSQPALSRQIKALEEELGLNFFDRLAHSIRLTHAGEIFLREARELLEHADLVMQRAREFGKGPRLRIGYAPSLASGMLSSAVESFVQIHPNTRMELFDLSTKEMLAALEADDLDVAVSVGQTRNAKGLTWSPLVRADWKLAVNRNHPLARKAKISPGEVAREPLLVFCQKDYPEYWDMINDWLRKHQLKPRIHGESDGISTLLAGVGSGLGLALVTTRVAPLLPGSVRLKPISNPPEALCIAAGHRTERANEKPLAVFLEELRRAAATFA